MHVHALKDLYSIRSIALKMEDYYMTEKSNHLQINIDLLYFLN